MNNIKVFAFSTIVLTLGKAIADYFKNCFGGKRHTRRAEEVILLSDINFETRAEVTNRQRFFRDSDALKIIKKIGTAKNFVLAILVLLGISLVLIGSGAHLKKLVRSSVHIASLRRPNSSFGTDYIGDLDSGEGSADYQQNSEMDSEDDTAVLESKILNDIELNETIKDNVEAQIERSLFDQLMAVDESGNVTEHTERKERVVDSDIGLDYFNDTSTVENVEDNSDVANGR